MNCVILIGRCGEYINSLDFGDGSKIITFGLATTKNIKIGEEWKQQDVWHKIVLHNSAINFATNGFCQHNNIISIRGVLNYYETEENGVKHKKAKIDVYKNSDIEFITSGKKITKNELGPKNIKEDDAEIKSETAE